MMAYVLKNKNLVVPIRAQTGDAIGDALTVIGPAHPDYQRWRQFATQATAEIEQEFGSRRPLTP